ncbi:MAG: helix-turn-helix domain-containing protein [Leptolyngbyaceae cyanobacterium]
MNQSSVVPSNIHTPYAITRQSLQNGALSLERWRVPPGHLTSPSWNHHTLMLQLSKTNRRHFIQLEGQEYAEVWPHGSFGLVPANSSLACSWEYTSEKLGVLIAPEFMQRLALETELLNPEHVELQPIRPHHDPAIESIVKLLDRELAAPNTGDFLIGSSLYLDSLTTALGIHLLRHYSAFELHTTTDINRLSSSKLRQAIAYIHDHLEQNISLQAIATYLGMSQYHFARWFKRSMGVPPYQYVIQRRIERAKGLLKNKNLNLADIALQCGFNSQGHLIRHFKKQVGMTPKQYREL